MNILIFHPDANTKGKKDATGAFIPQAHRFASMFRTDADKTRIVPFPAHGKAAARRDAVESAIQVGPEPGGVGKWDIVAFFCHGYRTGMQTGHTLKNLGSLVDVLLEHGAAVLNIPLYACSTADGKNTKGPVGGDGGFADTLRDKLSEAGRWGHIDAHSTVGHTTKNPYVRRFYMDGEAAGTGAQWLVAPGSPEWRTWRKLLALTDLKFLFPIMSEQEIYDYLKDK